MPLIANVFLWTHEIADAGFIQTTTQALVSGAVAAIDCAAAAVGPGVAPPFARLQRAAFLLVTGLPFFADVVTETAVKVGPEIGTRTIAACLEVSAADPVAAGNISTTREVVAAPSRGTALCATAGRSGGAACFAATGFSGGATLIAATASVVATCRAAAALPSGAAAPLPI